MEDARDYPNHWLDRWRLGHSFHVHGTPGEIAGTRIPRFLCVRRKRGVRTRFGCPWTIRAKEAERSFRGLGVCEKITQHHRRSECFTSQADAECSRVERA